MNTGKISTRYAAALYSLSKEKKCEEEVYEQMYRLSEAMIGMPRLTQALSNPMFTDAEKLGLLETAVGGKVNALLDTFFKFVIEKKREAFILFMSMSLQDLYRKDKNIVVAKVTSAVSLDKATLTKVKTLINNLSKSKDVLLRDEVNPAILGGYVLELNNYKLDASVQTKLETIERKLLSE